MWWTKYILKSDETSQCGGCVWFCHGVHKNRTKKPPKQTNKNSVLTESSLPSLETVENFGYELRVFNTTFNNISYIMEVGFIEAGNQNAEKITYLQ